MILTTRFSHGQRLALFRLLYAALPVDTRFCTVPNNYGSFAGHQNNQLYHNSKIFFCFVMLVPLNKAVNKFWDKHEKEVFPWFKERKRYAVVISASPDFLLREIQKRLNFETLICTNHNPKTGAIIGLNCRDEER